MRDRPDSWELVGVVVRSDGVYSGKETKITGQADG